MSFCVKLLGAYVDPVEELQKGYVHHAVVPSAYYQRTRPLPPANPTADSCRIRHVPALTAVDTPDTDTEDAVENNHHGSSEDSGRKRKRKRQHKIPNAAEKNAIRRHEEIRPFILAAHSLFLPMYMTAKSEAPHSPPPIPTGEAEIVTPRISPEIEAVRTPSTGDDVSMTSQCAVQQPGGDEPDDGVLLSMGATWQSQLCRITIPETGGRSGHKLILVDPPWENRSVNRNGGYATLPNRHLLGLPIKRLSGSGGALVGVWVTNREKLRRFVEEELLPAWHVQLAATWIWLKVSSEGAMLSQLDNNHHRPYEVLLLGYTTDVQMPPVTKNRGGGEEAKLMGDREQLRQVPCSTSGAAEFRSPPPHGYVIMSVPGEHSRKPPLALIGKGLLRPYVPTQDSQFPALELFARELQPGWTSWGNEPLRFQSSKYIRRN